MTFMPYKNCFPNEDNVPKTGDAFTIRIAGDETLKTLTRHTKLNNHLGHIEVSSVQNGKVCKFTYGLSHAHSEDGQVPSDGQENTAIYSPPWDVMSQRGYRDASKPSGDDVLRLANNSVHEDAYAGKSMKLNDIQVEILWLVHNSPTESSRDINFKHLRTPFYMGTEASFAAVPGMRGVRKAAYAISDIASRFQGKTPVDRANEMTALSFLKDFVDEPYTLYRQIFEKYQEKIKPELLEQATYTERAFWGLS
jgi:hypothetical protein